MSVVCMLLEEGNKQRLRFNIKVGANGGRPGEIVLLVTKVGNVVCHQCGCD